VNTHTTDKALTQWEHLLAGFEANKSDLPHVEGYCSLLQAHISDLRAVLARRAAMRTEVLRAGRDIKELLRGSRELGSRIGNGIRARYGAKSEKLVEFGIPPNRRGCSREEDEAPRNPTVPVK
jgi:hypothetical protein